ncbi:hypothetical protein OAE69_04150 [Gammaproteobacteria bacterium]|jgi:hypothetical protein|nr:hypothetical protein [Gammaproteobacteria bacterium]
MATLIDERPEDVETEEEVSQIQEEPQVEDTPQEEEIPDKYKGKSTAEIVRMHQEAEKLLGRQSSEVGELRSVVDNYIQTQLDTNTPATQEPEEDIDFFSDPDKAVERAIKNHPSIKAAEAQTQQYKQQTAQSHLQQRHPDMQEILQDGKFVEWIKGSKIRTQLFAQADTQYDYEAADELFTTWKERQQVVGQTVANEKASRKTAVKNASAGNAKGSGEAASRKVYRRSDIIKLMQTDPDRYLSLSDEIMQAYQEGRVRN